MQTCLPYGKEKDGSPVMQCIKAQTFTKDGGNIGVVIWKTSNTEDPMNSKPTKQLDKCKVSIRKDPVTGQWQPGKYSSDYCKQL